MANTLHFDVEKTLMFEPPLDDALSSPPSQIRRVHDVDALRRHFMQDRLAHAYLLGRLDPSYDPFCKWYARYDDFGQIQDVFLLYQGLSIPVAFFHADADVDPSPFFDACRDELPARFHFHVLGEQMTTFRKSHPVKQCQGMYRMGLSRSNYAAFPRPTLTSDHIVEQLGHRDTAAIMDLYGHYPDHFFEPYQLETGLYFGVKHPDHGLVSIAGVHVVSPEYDVAVIGNLVTHPSMRAKGLATSCTQVLLDALFGRVSFVALNVQHHNEPAIRMYTNFGFETNNTYFEGRCQDNT